MKRRSLYKSIFSVTVVMAALMHTYTMEARKIKTKHSLPKQSLKESAVLENNGDSVISMKSDSIIFCDKIKPAIRFYGFDKTVTSNQESFFVINGLNEAITGLEIRITYTDMKGRQLHRRDVKVSCELPPHETKRTDIRSWDTQKSFYYKKSVKPKRQATPFEVHIELLSITKGRND